MLPVHEFTQRATELRLSLGGIGGAASEHSCEWRRSADAPSRSAVCLFRLFSSASTSASSTSMLSKVCNCDCAKTCAEMYEMTHTRIRTFTSCVSTYLLFFRVYQSGLMWRTSRDMEYHSAILLHVCVMKRETAFALRYIAFSCSYNCGTVNIIKVISYQANSNRFFCSFETFILHILFPSPSKLFNIDFISNKLQYFS